MANNYVVTAHKPTAVNACVTGNYIVNCLIYANSTNQFFHMNDKRTRVGGVTGNHFLGIEISQEYIYTSCITLTRGLCAANEILFTNEPVRLLKLGKTYNQSILIL